MEIRRIFALRGPNIWSRYPVLEAWVDLGDLKDRPSSSMPGFNDRLSHAAPVTVLKLSHLIRMAHYRKREGKRSTN